MRLKFNRWTDPWNLETFGARNGLTIESARYNSTLLHHSVDSQQLGALFLVGFYVRRLELTNTSTPKT